MLGVEENIYSSKLSQTNYFPYMVQINFSKLYCEILHGTNLLVSVSPEGLL